jgi:hypothetical protein
MEPRSVTLARKKPVLWLVKFLHYQLYNFREQRWKLFWREVFAFLAGWWPRPETPGTDEEADALQQLVRNVFGTVAEHGVAGLELPLPDEFVVVRDKAPGFRFIPKDITLTGTFTTRLFVALTEEHAEAIQHCEACGEPFAVAHGLQRFCSHKCAMRNASKMYRARLKAAGLPTRKRTVRPKHPRRQKKKA